ncbi:hypothetical protein D3C87_81430 [compost metagenome]
MRINIEEILLKKDCPICGGEMYDSTPYSLVRKTWACKNKCYICVIPYFEQKECRIYIFGYRHKDIDLDDPNKFIMEEIDNSIRYWRKDERYLAKIMLAKEEEK